MKVKDKKIKKKKLKKMKMKMKKKKPRRGLLDPEDECITILRNFGNCLSHDIRKQLDREQHCFGNCTSLNPIALQFMSQIRQ